jgi:hypothetical protein
LTLTMRAHIANTNKIFFILCKSKRVANLGRLRHKPLPNSAGTCCRFDRATMLSTDVFFLIAALLVGFAAGYLTRSALSRRRRDRARQKYWYR